MHWNDWIIICWTISALFALRKRHWIDATWSACFAAFGIVDRMPPAALTSPLKYSFLAAGALLVAYQVGRSYNQYKKSMTAAR
jgi:hypothetical protein